MSIDLKFVELTADVLDIFFINYVRYPTNNNYHVHPVFQPQGAS